MDEYIAADDFDDAITNSQLLDRLRLLRALFGDQATEKTIGMNPAKREEELKVKISAAREAFKKAIHECRQCDCLR